MAADDLIFDPFDPGQTRTSWEKLARLRATCPVSRPFEGLAYTAKLQDTRDVFRDGRRFTLGPAGMRKPGAVVPYEERFLGEIDPPQHPRIRRLLVPYFTRAAALAEEPFARHFIRSRLEAVADAGGGNLSTAFSAIVPIAITAHVIGLGTDDVPAISRDILSNEQAEHFLAGTLSVAEAFPELSAFVDDAIDRRLGSDDPPDDAMTAMLLTEDAEIGRMSRRQVRTLAVNLLSGSGSTSSLLDNLFHRSLSDPTFDRALRSDASRIPAAVEESLRLEPPVLFLFRTAVAPTTLSGTDIAAGERICMGIASANRDEEHFADAEVFRIDREGEPDHTSFGWGPHLCIGIHLARMEARLALEELHDLFPPGRLRLAEGYRYEFPTDDFLRYAPTRLDVTLEGAPA